MNRVEQGGISASGFRPFDAFERGARQAASGLDALGAGPGAGVALLRRHALIGKSSGNSLIGMQLNKPLGAQVE
jgi:hypothetical protein